MAKRQDRLVAVQDSDGKVKIYNLDAGELVYVEILLISVAIGIFVGVNSHGAIGTLVGILSIGFLTALWRSKKGFKIWVIVSSLLWSAAAGYLCWWVTKDFLWPVLAAVIAGSSAAASHVTRREIERKVKSVD